MWVAGVRGGELYVAAGGLDDDEGLEVYWGCSNPSGQRGARCKGCRDTAAGGGRGGGGGCRVRVADRDGGRFVWREEEAGGGLDRFLAGWSLRESSR